MCRDSGQAQPRMVAFENRSGAYLKYVSTGSAESRRSQAGITWISAYLAYLVSEIGCPLEVWPSNFEPPEE